MDSTIEEIIEEKLTERLGRIEELLEKLLKKDLQNFKDVMNTEEIAIYLGVSPGHIRQLVYKGSIPVYKPNNSRRNYFKRKEIDEWNTSTRKKTNRELEIEAATRSVVMRNRR